MISMFSLFKKSYKYPKMGSNIWRNIIQSLFFLNSIHLLILYILTATAFPAKTMVSRIEEFPNPKKEMHPMFPYQFQCKSCNRLFPSFQALGGHRSGHHRDNLNNLKSADVSRVRMKRRKVHICRDCGLEFPVGQALGGHMRMHRKKKMSKKNESGGGGSELRFDLNLPPPPLHQYAHHFDFLNLSLGIQEFN